MNTVNDIGKPMVERIEKALRGLTYTDADIALFLVKLHISVQQEIGEEILQALPKEQQDQVTQLIESKGDMNQLATIIPKLSKEEMTKRVEEKLTKAAGIIEQAVLDADSAEQKIAEILKPTEQTQPAAPSPSPSA